MNSGYGCSCCNTCYSAVERAQVLLEDLEDFNEEDLKFAKGSTLYPEFIHFVPIHEKLSTHENHTLSASPSPTWFRYLPMFSLL